MRFSTLAQDCLLFTDCPNSTGLAGLQFVLPDSMLSEPEP